MQKEVGTKRFMGFDGLFLIILFLIGILTTFSYGVYYDQHSEQEILFNNIKEYAIRFGGSESSLVQEMTEAGIAAISENTERDHGIALFYPAGIVWWLNQISPYAGSVFWHMYTFVLVFGGICALYFLQKDMFGSRKIAAFNTLLFFLTPRMFAESHYNNKDMVLLSIVFLLFYWGRKVMSNCLWKDIIGFSVVGAFAVNLRIIGLWFFGLIGIYIVFYFVISGQLNKRIFGKGIGCILLWFGIYVLITPASWHGIIEHILYVLGTSTNFNRWGGYFLFGGQLYKYDTTGMPSLYLSKMILYTVPIIILLLLGLGTVFLGVYLLKKRFKNVGLHEIYLCLILFAGLFPVFWAELQNTSLYNGWRHFYFAYASMILVAGYAIYRINQLCRNRIGIRIRLGLAGIYVGVSAAFIIANFPFNYCYYNFLAGDSVETQYELDYWNLSVWQAYEAIFGDAAESEEISVSTFNERTGHEVLSCWEVFPKEMQQRVEVVSVYKWRDAEYMIVNMTYAMIFNPGDYEELQESYTLVEQLQSYGNVVCEVYKKR